MHFQQGNSRLQISGAAVGEDSRTESGGNGGDGFELVAEKGLVGRPPEQDKSDGMAQDSQRHGGYRDLL